MKFPPKASPLITKEKQKNKREPSLAAPEQSCFDMRDLQNYYSAIFTATVNYGISPCFRQLWFYSKRQQRCFCSNFHSAVNWNSYKCCSAVSIKITINFCVQTRQSCESAFVKCRCFRFFFK